MDWEARKQKRLFKKFYEKTGIELTKEPQRSSPLEEQFSERFYWGVRERPEASVRPLEALIEKHPDIPSLKNFLYVAYNYAGKSEKAKALLERTLQEHPDYVFGVTNKILSIRDKDEIKKFSYLLREPRDVREFEGYDNPVHISAFKNYQGAAAHYEMLIGEDDSAVQRLESLMDVGVEQPFLDQVARSLAMIRISKMRDRMVVRQGKSIKVSTHQKIYKDEYPDIAPSLTHPELEILYQINTESLKKEQQNALLALPRATLISDLELIVEDSMKRWVYWQETDFNANTHEFSIHAMRFLAALDSKQSLEKILNLMRMGDDFMDYWFSDWADGIFYPIIYALGESQLDQLKAFVLEKNIGAFSKLHISRAVGQVALHQLHRRAEVVEWFREVYQTFLDNPSDEDLLDTIFLSWGISSLCKLQTRELLPLIKEMSTREWIVEDIIGDLDEIEEEISKDFHPSAIDPLPESLEEYYSGEYLKRRVKSNDKSFDEFLDRMSGKAEMLISKFWSEMVFGKKDGEQKQKQKEEEFWLEEEEDDLVYTNTTRSKPIVTVKRDQPKVGRNAPCPCGSGKKYKKCCLRK